MLFPWLSDKENKMLLHHEAKFAHHFSLHRKIKKCLLIAQSDQADIISDFQSEHRYLLSTTVPDTHINQVALCLSNPDELPIEENSIDTLIIAHYLELLESPEAFLEESADTVTPEGYMIIFGLNPNSTWHLKYNKLKSRSNKPMRHGIQQWLSSRKISQWLNQYAYEIICVDNFLSPCAMLASQNKLQRAADMLITTVLPILCNAYVIVAKKKTIGVTPIRNSPQENKRFTRAIKGIANTAFRQQR